MELRGWWRWGQRETLDQAGTASSGVESGWEVRQNTGARGAGSPCSYGLSPACESSIACFSSRA
jgi:hypothetical protein